MRRNTIHAIGAFLAAILILGTVTRAEAANVPDIGRDAAIIVDGVSGRVLYERNAYEIRYPASLTKMMTLYLLFESFENGTLSFDSQLPTSRFAASQTPTKLNLKPGETIDAKTAMEAIIVRSANDVAVVVAEAIGGTESDFARMMTQKAGELGMLNTHFANASGLPNAQQISTAADMALLGRRLAYDFPEYYKFLARTEFQYKGRRYPGHNNLLGGAFEGADGIKTGYTRASGFNLVTSVVRGNKHIVGVVLGGRTAASRDAEMMKILSTAFEEVDRYPLLVAYANVPWKNGDGPKIVPSWDATVPAPVVLAAFGDQQQTASPHAIAVAELPSQGAIIPREKPTVPTPANAATPFADGDLIASLIDSLSLPTKASVDADNPIETSLSEEATQEGAEEADASDRGGWSVQIGAFASEATATRQLQIYAERSRDILGQAERLIVAYAGEGGRMFYRARFGPFEESEARAVCQQMMTQGETCFASQGPGT